MPPTFLIRSCGLYRSVLLIHVICLLAIVPPFGTIRAVCGLATRRSFGLLWKSTKSFPKLGRFCILQTFQVKRIRKRFHLLSKRLSTGLDRMSNKIDNSSYNNLLLYLEAHMLLFEMPKISISVQGVSPRCL